MKGVLRQKPYGDGTFVDISGVSKRKVLCTLILLVVVLAGVCLFVGSSRMGLANGVRALMGRGSAANIRIIWRIRMPRVLAAMIAGAGLSVAGLMMQTCLGNAMASPSTLGVSNAAVFGANVSIIAMAGGFLDTGNHLANFDSVANPFATSLMAFVFSVVSVLVILGLCRTRRFAPNVVVLSGIALGSVWTAATTILQFYATDVGLSAAVIWSFGDLGRATYRTDLIMGLTVLACLVVFSFLSRFYNAILSGDDVAISLGVDVPRLRFVTLLLASMVVAVCVSFLGMIGFVGIICPHLVKRLWGQDHYLTIPASALAGSVLLLFADTVSRSIGNGSALPVGAITSLLGAPFFVVVILSKGRR